MPHIAQWIDDLRTAFGEAIVNQAIRRGMKGEPTFWAEENGHTVGTRKVRDPAAELRCSDKLAIVWRSPE